VSLESSWYQLFQGAKGLILLMLQSFLCDTLYITIYLLSDETNFSVSLLDDCANDRSIKIFLQISRRAFAIVLAATSHLNTIAADLIQICNCPFNPRFFNKVGYS